MKRIFPDWFKHVICSSSVVDDRDFFLTYAALIITIVAVIVPKRKLSWGRQKRNYGKVMDVKQQNQKNKPPPTNNQTKKQTTSKTDHGPKVKQAQALTTVCNQPRLSLRLQQEIVKVQCKDWPLCARRSILDLLPLFHSAS